MITAPIFLPSWKLNKVEEEESEKSSDIQAVSCDISRKAKLAKRASLHTSKVLSPTEKPTFSLDPTCQSSVPESWPYFDSSNSTSTTPDSNGSLFRSPDDDKNGDDDDDDADDDYDDDDESSRSSDSTAASTPSSSSPISTSVLLQAPLTSLKDVAYEDLPDQELLKTLALFLRGGKSEEKDSSKKKKESRKVDNSSPNRPEVCDLVVTIRDFAYPKSHPYHIGDFPPEPSSEESEDEEELNENENEEGVEEEIDDSTTGEEEERASGYARGMYDFDAENSTELTFKEGDYMWIHCLQFPGWYLGEINGQQGLVPSNYVELV